MSGYILALVLLLSCLGTWGLRRLALARNIIDMPNARSSHTIPTPRGGGVAIVLAFMAGLLFGPSGAVVSPVAFWGLLGGGGVIALLGFCDDLFSLSARLRFFVHLAASAWVVYLLGGWPLAELGFVQLPLGYLGAVLMWLGLAWSINLYNFMDGIDGLAAGEAVFLGLAGAWLTWSSGGEPWPWCLLASASAGFLLLNWPPARIFMGDAGSGFLGFAFGALLLERVTQGPVWPWLILYSGFWVDATLTLLRRACRGIRLSDAHRTHAYQWASRRLGGHLPVSAGMLALNGLVVLPAAWISQHYPALGGLAFLVVLAVWAGLAWWFDAGVPEAEVAGRQQP